MKWKVKTDTKTYVVEANSSVDAVEIVNTTHNDSTAIRGVSVEPKNLMGKAKQFWRNNFGK